MLSVKIPLDLNIYQSFVFTQITSELHLELKM